MGPAPLEKPVDFSNFDEAVVVINGERSLPVLNLCLSNLPTHALLRSRHLVPILSNLNSRSDWRESLVLCKTLQVRRESKDWLSETGLTRVSHPSENLEKLWGKLGKPNAIQHSVGLAMELCGPNGSVSISGPTFYLGAKIYSDSQEKIKFEEGEEDFRVSEGLASHNPVSNFMIMKRLMESGVIIGDPVVIEILNMDLSEYLSELDKYRGIGRD